MERLIEFAVDRKAAKDANKKREAWLKSCRKRKAEYATKFPIIQKLDDALQQFRDSCYDEDFRSYVIRWIENTSMHLYSGNTKLSDEEVNAFIKNFEWYIGIINMLLANQGILQDDMFGLINSETNIKYSPIAADIGLVKDVLNLCNKTFGRVIKDTKLYEKRIANYQRLQKAYDKFMKSTREYVDDLSSKDMHQIGDLIFLEKYLNTMMKTFKTDITDTEPVISEFFSQKINDVNRALTIAVIKMFGVYIKTYYRNKGRTIVRKPHNLITIVANSLLSDLNNKKTEYFTENQIKGILKEQ